MSSRPKPSRAHADYLGAFHAAGLQVRHCVESVLTEAAIAAKRRAFANIPAAACVGLPALLVSDVEKV